MIVTRNELVAFVDGELSPKRMREVEKAIAGDETLAARADAHRALDARLSAHLAPILEAELPDRLTGLLVAQRAEVVDLTAARERRRRTPVGARWNWVVGSALAASLALALFMPRESDKIYVGTELAAALEEQLVATQTPDTPTQILLSFRDSAGDYCRAFAGQARSGIACRDSTGWRLRMEAEGTTPVTGEYLMAGNDTAEVLRQAQAMADGPALNASQEQAALSSGWQ